MHINQDRVLVYNGDEKLLVPEGKRVLVSVVAGEETTFRLEDRVLKAGDTHETGN